MDAPPTPARRRADAIRNDRKVREAAEAVFLRRGKALSMDEVAEQAQVSKGTVYNVFGSRDLLIDGLTIAHLDRAASSYRAAMSGEDPWEGLVNSVLTPTMGVAATADVMAPDAEASPVRTAYLNCHAALDDLLALLKQRGLVRPEISATQVATLFRGLYQALPSYAERDVAATIELGRIILRGIRS
jgi:AcrR family transcriptional regulator